MVFLLLIGVSAHVVQGDIFLNKINCALMEHSLCSYNLHPIDRAAIYRVMTILGHQNYRSYLKNILAEKASVNASYSLRALAKKLGLAPSYLSAVLNGKKNLSHERALIVATILNLKEAEKEYFCLLVQMESTKNLALKEAFLKRLQYLNPEGNVQNLSLDHFKIISDWQHFAIMAAIDLMHFETTAENFAYALGISKIEAELALERLERLEMIEKNNKGRYQKTNINPRVVSPGPNAALRNYHKQTLQKAIESLETQMPQEKVIGSETFAIDDSQIDDFRELAEKFFNDAIKLAKKAKKKNRVYHLGVQFFNYTHSMNKGERK